MKNIQILNISVM